VDLEHQHTLWRDDVVLIIIATRRVATKPSN
jgi:hypothetical protein